MDYLVMVYKLYYYSVYLRGGEKMKWNTYSINFDMLDTNKSNPETNVYLIYAKGMLHAINELIQLLNENDCKLIKINSISIKRP